MVRVDRREQNESGIYLKNRANRTLLMVMRWQMKKRGIKDEVLVMASVIVMDGSVIVRGEEVSGIKSSVLD